MLVEAPWRLVEAATRGTGAGPCRLIWQGKRRANMSDTTRESEKKLDDALEGSMDASDPPATSRPDDHGEPVPSSGFPDKPEPEKSGRA